MSSLQPAQRKLRGIGRLRSRIRRVMIIYHHDSRGSGQRGLRLYYGLTGMRNCAPRFSYQFSPGSRVNSENRSLRYNLWKRMIVSSWNCTMYHMLCRGACCVKFAEIYVNFPLWRVHFFLYIVAWNVGNVSKGILE